VLHAAGRRRSPTATQVRVEKSLDTVDHARQDRQQRLGGLVVESIRKRCVASCSCETADQRAEALGCGRRGAWRAVRGCIRLTRSSLKRRRAPGPANSRVAAHDTTRPACPVAGPPCPPRCVPLTRRRLRAHRVDSPCRRCLRRCTAALTGTRLRISRTIMNRTAVTVLAARD
jgi:hypothetical protein